MKYNPPFGSADPNAAYTDRNTPGAVSGSRVPALALEAPQREIEAVIVAAGITPSKADMTQLLQAIGNLIAGATGGSGDENYVLMTQARSRLPIFPEILTSDGRLPVVSPSAGTVRVPAGYSFLHRGVFNVTTVQEDFATSANKTYHLRWSNVAGFALKDVSDVAYNPFAKPEADVSFDSTYDDMLVAKVDTSGGNLATITNLTNKHVLRRAVTQSDTITRTSSSSEGGLWVANVAPVSLLWARTPDPMAVMSRVGFSGALSIVPEDMSVRFTGTYTDATGSAVASFDRYSFAPVGTMDLNQISASRQFVIQLSAILLA